MVIGDIAEHRQVQLVPRMVGDDAGHVHIQLADLRAVEEIHETVIEFGGEQQDTHPFAGRAHAPFLDADIDEDDVLAAVASAGEFDSVQDEVANGICDARA